MKTPGQFLVWVERLFSVLSNRLHCPFTFILIKKQWYYESIKYRYKNSKNMYGEEYLAGFTLQGN